MYHVFHWLAKKKKKKITKTRHVNAPIFKPTYMYDPETRRLCLIGGPPKYMYKPEFGKSMFKFVVLSKTGCPMYF